MASITAVKDQLLRHFSHPHSLSLVHLQQPNHKNENSDDEDEEKDDLVEEVHHGGECNLCCDQILSFHLCYYACKSCDYSLHTFCAELPETLQNYSSHPGHTLKFSYKNYGHDICSVCKLEYRHINFYYCIQYCGYRIDARCVTMSEEKIKHPSHRHQLERMFGHIASICVACGNKHEGVFFQCTTCPIFRINLDCALLPARLLIQISTNGNFTHSHPLTLAYSFPYSEWEAKFRPRCRICNGRFYSHLWNYKCDKCLYYVHVGCATSKREPLSVGKINKNYREDEHPNLLHCPFQHEGDNLLKHYMSNQKECISRQHDGEMLTHSSHQHPLILFEEQTSVDKRMVSLHDPMKRVQLLCDGCVKPIMAVPFYMCYQYVDEQCCFVLHEWCAKLPSQIKDYFGHPKHPLVLTPNISSKFFGVFECKVCKLESNGFAYECTMCDYYVDINCAFIPKEITHDAHPNHLLLRVKPSTLTRCKACSWWTETYWGFKCPSCDFYIHVKCALLLPRVIKHKLDTHPLSLRYEPAENHIGEYFCELCEVEFNPWWWFYHCTTCAQSMHTACVPLILQSQCEQATYVGCVYNFINIKFGRTLKIKDHPHRLSFVQGLQSDGNCSNCREVSKYRQQLQYRMIFKCLECGFAIHYDCASSSAN